MVKPLSFKGDTKPKKRKAPPADGDHTERKAQKALVVADEGTGAASDDDSWVTADVATDITGPIIFALPSDPPTCIACDATGKVFTSELENIVEGDLASAEPHDVRQVWVANRVAGTDEISFKGHHGRYAELCPLLGSHFLDHSLTRIPCTAFLSYLSCDQSGILSAAREAISPEESFLCIPSADTPGTFHVQTARERFLAVADPAPPGGRAEIRGDADSVSFQTTFRIRMQARFKPRLKANKESRAREKISRKELEEAVGRRLEDAEVKRLKKARAQGDYHEAILDVRVKGKHDKYS